MVDDDGWMDGWMDGWDGEVGGWFRTGSGGVLSVIRDHGHAHDSRRSDLLTII